MNLLKHCKITSRKQSSATDTRLSTTSFHDMAGFDGVLFMAIGSTLLNTASTAYAIVQSATANSTSTVYQTTAISFETMTTGLLDYKNLVVDVYKPEHRYVRLLVSGASSGHMRTIIAQQYKSKMPGSTNLYDSTTLRGSTVVVGHGT